MTDNPAGQNGGWTEAGRAAANGLEETWGALAEVTYELSDTEWSLPTECPGWDVQDQLSHLIGIERSLMGDPTPEWDGPLGPHVKNDFGALNERWVAVRRPFPGAAVRQEFVEVTATRLGQLERLTEDEWSVVGWSPVGQVPYAVFMEVRVLDSWVHEQDVRRALDRPGGLGNGASAISLARVEGAMGFVVGKKAACPDGTAVRFVLAGPGADERMFTIAVEGGRAKPVDAPTPPTVTISLSGLDFARLGCGRATPGEVEAAGGIDFGGDAAIGQTVLDAMNIMI